MKRALIAGLAGAVAVAALLVLTTTPDRPRHRPPHAAPSERAQGRQEQRERKATRPTGPRVQNEAFGASRSHARRAIRDLKRLDLWRRLTDHLYAIKLGSRLGRENIPRDGHLADAYVTGLVEAEGSGALCDIMFFPAAIADDLARWRSYHDEGAIAEPPPSPRRFWAALLAHELAHCLEGPRGEPVAERWEDEAMRRYEARLES